MKIIALQSENVKRLRAVTIHPDGSMVVIRGDNGAGKSSVLDSIAYALGGQALCPPQVIRNGQEHAEVKVDLGELIVTRRWTASGSSLRVENREGARFPSPQAILDKLVGKLSFDPLAFTREKPKDQAETLRKLVGLDFTINDKARQRLYEERTVVNREIAALKAVANGPAVDGPDEEVSIKDLLHEQGLRLGQQKKTEDLGRDARMRTGEKLLAAKHLAEAILRVQELERQLEAARASVAVNDQALRTAETREIEAIAAANAQPQPDLEGIRAQIAAAEQTNANVRAKKARAAEAIKLITKEEEAKKLSDQIEILDLQKAHAVADAHFPIAGLGFSDEGVTLNGLPLEQASSAEQLRVSLAVGIALNPKLKVLLIRDGSLLDENSMRLVGEMAETAGAQVWVEVVGKEGGVPGVVIEDGAVEGAPVLAEVRA
jgi:DNA repair exonuclease SbcCD ATPase subunit